MSKRIENVSDLQPDRTNANKGTQRGRGMVEASLREVGAGRSILADKDGRIIAGNKTLEAWADIGGEIEVVRTDGKRLVVVQREDLDLSDDTGTARKLAYYDNRASEVGLEWDTEQLLADLSAGVDLSSMFRQDELDALLEGMQPTPEPTDDPGGQTDKAEELRQKYGTQLEQVWSLGAHRLMIGDSTNPQNVAQLMQDEKADLLFTSPPYAQQRDYRDGATEKVSDWDALMRGVFGAAICSDACQILVNLGLVHREGEWMPYWDGWIEWMRAQGWRRFGWYVWDKLSGMPGDWDGRLAPSFEFIWHFNKVSVHPAKVVECKDAGRVVAGRTRGADGELRVHTGTKNGDAVQSHKIHDSVIRTGSTKGQQLDHPATFPIALPTFAIESWPGLVYEPFSGSGTTLIACEILERKCLAMEISPAYAAVAINRWEVATGLKAVCASSDR